ncbi:fimbrial biogenesis chaperone [Salegentibacter salarius]|uniref:Molecular chaperone n=1 Tax=Salegentibacter salarius TaxID=435906 RepID=A0A2N0U2Y0_9FLAO|nr:molecular chaperone [Salegentibacter salarius]OEY71217.1 molecular chaperone [Salegentibacter salarius]PKD21371.1 molecular chaperone [Salegentibacter salarius]SLJ93001.1 P pilus assembly protein, chaperone PapD [Salegentibacter salarius]
MIKKLLSPLLLLFIFIFSGLATYAQGDLMIMPKRLVFDGSERSQEINLANTGSDTAVYAISFVNYIMTEKGNFEQVEEPADGQRFSEDFLRYFPRRVSLAPNEAQTIRVQLTRTGNLEQGEYRSHMYFRAVEEQTALGAEEAEESEGISINIKTVFGISIPIIVREGESTTKIDLTELSLNTEGENPKLSLVINRSGNMSVYGNLTATHIAPNGTQTEVGMVKGVSVYTPNSKRFFSFELRNAAEVDLNNGKLKVSYAEDKGEVLAKTEKSLK